MLFEGGHVVNINHLKSFLAVVETASFSKAAEGLFTTQPTLSRHITALEDELGVQLLDRDRHHVRMTQAGELLFQEGKHWIAQMISIERRVTNAGCHNDAKLDLICSPMYSQVLRKVYRKFTEIFPSIICNIRQVESGKEFEVVQHDDADIGILFYTPELPAQSNLRCANICSAKMCLVCGVDAPIGRKGVLSLDDFKDEKLIIARSPMNDWLAGVHQSVLPYFKQVIYVETLETVILSISANQGIAIWPEIVVRDTQNYSKVLNVPAFKASSNLVAVWREDNRNGNIKRFIDMCSEMG